MLTYKRASELLSYNPETGELRWKVQRQRCPLGSLAGTINSKGYRVIKIDDRSYKAHRIAWLLYYGEWPENQVDHEDLDKSNNRILNLRSADNFGNAQNRGLKKTNTSGIRGVSFYKPLGKWRVQIVAKGKTYHLGYFTDLNKAAAAYAKASNDHHQEYGRVAVVNRG